MNENQEKIIGSTPEISIPKPEVKSESLSIENEITRLEAMHVLGQIDLGDEKSSFSKIYIDLLEEYEKRYGELPKEPFVRDEASAREIINPSSYPSPKAENASSNKENYPVQTEKRNTVPSLRVPPLSLFEEPLNI